MFDALITNNFSDALNYKNWPSIITSQLPKLVDGAYSERGNPEGPCFTVQSNIPYDCVMEISKHMNGKPLECLEIGRREGWSTRMILSAISKVGGHLDSIDVDECNILPKLTEEEISHYSQYQSRCQDFKFTKKYDFIFIDTWHRYSGTLEELSTCWPLLNEPGILIVHKCESHFNCKKAVFEWAQKNKKTFCFDTRGQGMAIFVKPNYPLCLRDRTAEDQISNEGFKQTN